MKIPVLLFLISLASVAFPQSSSRFTVVRDAVASGGATSSSSNRFQIGSTIAQPLAAIPSSPRFAIQGGLWITPSPILFPPVKSGTNLLLSFQTDPGMNYNLIYSDSLLSPSWQNLTNITGDGTVKTVTNSTRGFSQRFYRLVQQ
jgi:hypothetical protein